MTDSIEKALEEADEQERERPIAEMLYEQIASGTKVEHWRARLEREHPEFKLHYVIPSKEG